MIVLISLFSFSCTAVQTGKAVHNLTPEHIQSAKRLGIDPLSLKRMESKPLFRFSEEEIGVYLGYIQRTIPDLRSRIQFLARRVLGQRYRIYLLGEFPFEIYDPDPLYSLRESDCVVFVEHVYAMALGHDWPSFFCILQRIRYRDGEIGLLTRNHYTELDWILNNSWLMEDMTAVLAGDEAVETVSVIQKARFFKKFGIGQDLKPDTLNWSYIPYEMLPRVIDHLKPGDFVNIVRGRDEGRYVGHVGLITHREDSTVCFLHSIHPRVKEQPLIELYTQAEAENEMRRQTNRKIAEKNEAIRIHNDRVRKTGKGQIKTPLTYKPLFFGFKFFRLRDDPLTELIERYGPEALDIRVRMKW